MMSVRSAAAALVLVLGGCVSIAPNGTPPGATAPGAKAAPDSAILMAADATRDAGRYAEALEIYRRLLVNVPAPAAARYGAAECVLALGQPQEAASYFDTLVTNPEFHGRALQGRGLAELAVGKLQPAGQSLREATESDASLWRAWNGLGDLADRARQPAAAAGFYAKALALRPNSAMIVNNIGYSLLISGNFAGAIREFHKALGFEPENKTIQTNLRLALAASGDYEQALRSAPSEQMPELLNDVGYIAIRRGDYAAAEGYLATAQETSTTYNTVVAKNLDWLKDMRKSPE